MTKMKLVFALLAVLTGIGGAYATRIQETNLTQYNWVDKNNELVFIGTIAQAEANCPGNEVFCLRASDSPATIVYMFQ
jgi:hypothetical protein